ncbi:MAG: TrkH family potassium uptake protein [Firmicutes bacterium]|nr:TrkH family potassium uptake protein [Bacillota bacterium]
MDYGIVLKTLGFLLIIEAGSMLLPLAVASCCGGPDAPAFAAASILTVAVGWGGLRCKPNSSLVSYREAFLIVVFGWLLAAAFGSLPFILAGSLSPIDAFFETVSGFTTTGITALANVELQPRGILLWRSLTHWLGGMGIIVVALAVLPALGVGSMRIFRAESPGPVPAKLVPRLDQTAKILYGIYLALTVAQILALKLVGWSWFDSTAQAFSTMGTGGFSTRSGGMAAWADPGAEWITILFMFAAGVNFSLYYSAISGKAAVLVKDSEFRLYSGVILTAALMVAINIAPLYPGQVDKIIRHSLFQTVSMGSSTAFHTINYEQWPGLSQMVLSVLMFMGGCAGSTSSALKQVRVLIIFKAIRRRLIRLIHPQAVLPIVLGDTVVDEDTVTGVLVFTLFYLVLLVAASLLLLTQGLDILTSVSAAAAALWNLGRGFGAVNLTAAYSSFNAGTKLFLTACMLLGRLEIYPVVVLLLPTFWRRA